MAFHYTVNRYKYGRLDETWNWRNFPGTPADIQPAVYITADGEVTNKPTAYCAKPALSHIDDIATRYPNVRADRRSLNEHGFGKLILRYDNVKEIWEFSEA